MAPRSSSASEKGFDTPSVFDKERGWRHFSLRWAPTSCSAGTSTAQRRATGGSFQQRAQH